jgi:CheY-like chemotaxis protein
MKKILIVDDVKLLRDVYKRHLATFQVEVFIATEGEEALEIARRELPDLIIMDRYMPKMNGIASCLAIKADPSLAHIPVIMATNAARQDDADECIRAGASGIISKPIESKALLDIIKEYLPEINRRPARVAEALEMKIVADQSLHPALTEDISVNGAFAVSDLHVAVNEELMFSFLLPGKEVPIEAQGRVVWLRKGGAVPGFGIEFSKITGQGLPMLRLGELKDFVQSKVKN